ncbi:hypothetical protein [Paenibacillus sp. IITD108]|uniref:hypothetical protein n=1 Tax=Paenibacillus sp. IITD108 TaxID=3116649 RepID=UPI002F42AC01
MKKWFIGIGVASLLAVGTYIYASGDRGTTGVVGREPVQEAPAEESTGSMKSFVIEANIAYTVEKEEMGEFADLVVLGVPQEDIGDRKSDIRYFPKDPGDRTDTPRDIEFLKSFVNFKIEAVYKNATGIKSGDTITISERTAMVDDEAGKRIVKLGHFDELQAKQQYVLFLKKAPDKDIYYVIRDNDGREKIAHDNSLEEQVEAILKKHRITK